METHDGDDLPGMPFDVIIIEQREGSGFARTVAGGTVLVDDRRDVAVKGGSGCRCGAGHGED